LSHACPGEDEFFFLLPLLNNKDVVFSTKLMFSIPQGTEHGVEEEGQFGHFSSRATWEEHQGCEPDARLEAGKGCFLMAAFLSGLLL